MQATHPRQRTLRHLVALTLLSAAGAHLSWAQPPTSSVPASTQPEQQRAHPHPHRHTNHHSGRKRTVPPNEDMFVARVISEKKRSAHSRRHAGQPTQGEPPKPNP
jgi:hypothetical protein